MKSFKMNNYKYKTIMEDLYYKTIRGLNIPSLYKYLRESANYCVESTILLAFYIRDCRGGKGERFLGRKCFVWLFLNYPEKFFKVVSLIPEYGRWDDLLWFFPGKLNLTDIRFVRENYMSDIKDESYLERLRQLQQYFVELFCHQLEKDKSDALENKMISNCAKWAPTEGSSQDRSCNFVKTICKTMDISPKIYRKKYVTPLRWYLSILESYMCKNMWDYIDYTVTPSCALKKYKKAFSKHSPYFFTFWYKSRKRNTKIPRPYELLRNVNIKGKSCKKDEDTWKLIEKKVQKSGVFKNSIVVIDNTASMYDRYYLPLEIAVSTGLIISSMSPGIFRKHVITFNVNPEIIKVKNVLLHNKFKQVFNFSWSCNINIKAIYDLILSNSISHKLSPVNIPEYICILTDKSFNTLEIKDTNLKLVDKEYEIAGYTRPSIVHWCIDESKNFKVENFDKLTLITGFDPLMEEEILTSGFLNLSETVIIKKTLDLERYTAIKDAL